jgi:AcrR family transcriptional regulator
MARTVNAAVHTIRREAFTDAALRLIQGKGYEQMSVQDVLDEVDASRGAFYHYFDSKAALLEAVLERMTDVVLAGFAPLIEDPSVPALEKIERLFSGIAQWKNQRIELVTQLLQVWLSDDNAVVREKFRRALAIRMVPVLGAIVRQGRDEGVFKVTAPENTARSLWSVMQGAQEAALELFLARRAGTIPFEAVEATFAAYAEGFERIAGVPLGSIHVVDDATLRLWFGERDRKVRSSDR